MYTWDWSWVWNYRYVLLQSCWLTLLLNAQIIVVGVLSGGLLCACRLASSPALRWPAAAFVEFMRAMPVLVVMIWLFFCLPIFARGLLGVQIRPTPWTTAVLALGLSTGAYMSEIFRAGLASVPRGELEAAQVFGLSRFEIAWRILVPHAFRSALPPFANQLASTVKLSSLASFIAVPEVLYTAGALIHETFRPLEFYTFVALAYLVMILPFTLLAAWAERSYGVQHA